MRRRPGEPPSLSSGKPPFEAILDKYNVRYFYRHGWITTWCPFHEDSVPSFSLNLEGGYVCHGCGEKGGDAIDFVMAMEHCTFGEAKRIVAEITGQDLGGTEVEIPAKAGTRPGRRAYRPKFRRRVFE